jgi:dipeptidase
MHSPGLSHTTASMVAPLATDDRAAALWVCLGNPCLGVFLPLYPAARIPPRLALGDAEADDASPWWAMHRLRSLVERDPTHLAPRVRARWDELENELVREAARLDESAAPAAVLEAFMERAVDRCLATARALARECGS